MTDRRVWSSLTGMTSKRDLYNQLDAISKKAADLQRKNDELSLRAELLKKQWDETEKKAHEWPFHLKEPQEPQTGSTAWIPRRDLEKQLADTKESFEKVRTSLNERLEKAEKQWDQEVRLTNIATTRAEKAEESLAYWKEKAEESFDREEQARRGLARLVLSNEERALERDELSDEIHRLIRAHAEKRDAWIADTKLRNDTIVTQANRIEELESRNAIRDVDQSEVSGALRDALTTSPGEHPSAPLFRVQVLVGNLAGQIRYYKGEVESKQMALDALRAELAKVVYIGPVTDDLSDLKQTTWSWSDGITPPGVYDPRGIDTVYPIKQEED